MKKLFGLMACALTLILLSSTAFAAQKVIRLAHSNQLEDFMHIAYVMFKDEVEKKTNGNIKVEIFPNGELGNDTTTTPAVQMGELTMCLVNSPHLAPLVPDIFVLDMPFAWDNRDQLWKALGGELGQMLEASMAKVGLKPIHYFDGGFRELANTKRAITSLDDIKGLKIRVLENPIHIAFWKALGANPTPMATGEVFTALQQKTVDGSENSYTRLYYEKLYEVMTNISDSKHICTPYLTVMNLKFFNSLTPEEQKIIMDAAKSSNEYQLAQSSRVDKECFDKIIASGVKFTAIPDNVRAQIRAIAQPAALEIIKQRVSPPVIAAFQKAAPK